VQRDGSFRPRLFQQQTILEQPDGWRAEKMAGNFTNAVVKMPEHRAVAPARVWSQRDATRDGVGHQLVEDTVQLCQVAIACDTAQDDPAARVELGAAIVKPCARLLHVPVI
jgi:hypothetical protein